MRLLPGLSICGESAEGTNAMQFARPFLCSSASCPAFQVTREHITQKTECRMRWSMSRRRVGGPAAICVVSLIDS